MKTLDETLLQRLADWRPDSPAQALELTAEDGWKATVRAECVDVVGCRLWEVQLTSPAPAADALKDRAERIASRVTGLLEPLRLVEADAGLSTALLRSDRPLQRGPERFYYEVELRGQTTSVRRFQAARPGARRQQVAFALTHEALAKLVADLAA
jgi:hypothetical protein